MPITNFTIEEQLASALSDTIVDVIPCWGGIFIVCTTKIYRYDYLEGETGSYTLAYNFASAALGAEKIQCAIGFNGYLYIGTTQPDPANNARILRLVPPTDDIDDIDGDTNLLTATAELTAAAVPADEHNFLGLAVISGRLHAYYQYNDATSWLHSIYRQTAHGTWSVLFNNDGNTTTEIEVDPSTHYGTRRSVFEGNGNIGLYCWNDSAGAMYRKVGMTGVPGGSDKLTTASASSYVHVAKDVDGFIGFDDSTLFNIDGSRGLQSFGAANGVRVINATQLWYQGYLPVAPATISSVSFFGGIPLGDTLFIGAKITDSLAAVNHAIVAREPDGNWYVLDIHLSTGVLYAPRYPIFLEGAWRLIAPHVQANNFSILTPEFGGTVWTARAGL